MSQRHIYIFTLAENVFTTTLPLADTDFVPELIVKDAIHGIAQIELINFRESAVLIPCWSFQIKISGQTFQINLLNHIHGAHSIETQDANSKQFECPCVNLEMDGVLIDNEIRLINLSIANRNARFYIRFPLFLYTYSVHIRVRCRNLVTSGGSWSEWSPKQTIQVASSLITKRFEVKERVLFTPTHSNHSIPGTIIKPWSAFKDDGYQIQTGWIGPQRKCWDVPVSRIYRNGPHLKHLVIDIDKRKQNIMCKQLLFGTQRKDLYDDLFICLADIYEVYAAKYCEAFASIQDTDYGCIGSYIAKYVIGFVFSTEDDVRYEAVKCIMNESDGTMQLMPVWHSLIANYMQLVMFHKDSDLFIANPTQMNAKFSCNLCGVEMSVYQWMYECNGGHNVLNKHFVCMMCGHNIIHQHTQMVHILTTCLHKYFYRDCIQLIVSFVCGSVVNH